MGVKLPKNRLETPYCSESHSVANRTCGLAVMGMTFGKFGISFDEETIWREISFVAPFIGGMAKTNRLAQAAIPRGLDAVAVKTRSPERVLRDLTTSDAVLIPNYRPYPDLPVGHYCVVTEVSDAEVFYHDPAVGPNRRLRLDEFLSLWQPLPEVANQEITGNVLVAIQSRQRSDKTHCDVCGHDHTQLVTCAQCGYLFAPLPLEALGCFNSQCKERHWERIYCPACDASVGAVANNLT